MPKKRTRKYSGGKRGNVQYKKYIDNKGNNIVLL